MKQNIYHECLQKYTDQVHYGVLIKEYKDGMNLDAGLKLAVRSLKKVSGKDFDLDKLDGAFLNTTDKTFTRMTVQDFVRLNK